jgi:hypothetical protein
MREGPSSLFSTHISARARLISANAETERSETNLQPYEHSSIELKQKSDFEPRKDMPDLVDNRNYKAIAGKGSAASTNSLDDMGIHIRNEIDVSNHSAV